jgi:hypothetical protein
MAASTPELIRQAEAAVTDAGDIIRHLKEARAEKGEIGVAFAGWTGAKRNLARVRGEIYDDGRVVQVNGRGREHNAVSDVSRLMVALDFAAHAHRNQRRKDVDRTPYVNHVIGVAHLLTEIGRIDDVDVLRAAVLHDAVEDTDVTIQDIEREFGAAVGSVVAHVTDDKALSKVERKRQQVAHANATPHRAKLVKLADKLHNLRSLRANPPAHWAADRVEGYFVWSWFCVRGMRGTNRALEDALGVEFSAMLPRAFIRESGAEQTARLDVYYANLSGEGDTRPPSPSDGEYVDDVDVNANVDEN